MSTTAQPTRYVTSHTVRLGVHYTTYSVSCMRHSNSVGYRNKHYDLSVVRHAGPTLTTVLFVQVAPLAETGPQRITKNRYGLDLFLFLLMLSLYFAPSTLGCLFVLHVKTVNLDVDWEIFS